MNFVFPMHPRTRKNYDGLLSDSLKREIESSGNIYSIFEFIIANVENRLMPEQIRFNTQLPSTCSTIKLKFIILPISRTGDKHKIITVHLTNDLYYNSFIFQHITLVDWCKLIGQNSFMPIACQKLIPCKCANTIFLLTLILLFWTCWKTPIFISNKVMTI